MYIIITGKVLQLFTFTRLSMPRDWVIGCKEHFISIYESATYYSLSEMHTISTNSW